MVIGTSFFVVRLIQMYLKNKNQKQSLHSAFRLAHNHRKYMYENWKQLHSVDSSTISSLE